MQTTQLVCDARNARVSVGLVSKAADTHKLGIAHGDIHPKNLMVHKKKNGSIGTRLIDWDNAVIPGLPPPRSMGTRDFMAPESMEAFINKRSYVPDIKTELCSAAKVIHVLAYGRPSYVPSNDRDFEQGTINGVWNSDPAQVAVIDLEVFGGISNQWATAEFADLFRRGLARDRDNRPVMNDWLSALLKVAKEGFSSCQFCDSPMLTAPRIKCPYCNNLFPSLAAITRCGHRYVANGRPVIIGRNTIAASSGVSYRHAVFSKMGPETFITDLASKNGTFRWVRGRWVKLPSHRRCPVKAGDRLRCGNVILQIVSA